MAQAKVEVMTKDESLVDSFFMHSEQLHFIYDYLNSKGGSYYRNYVQSLFINVTDFKKAMFIDLLQTSEDEDSPITAIKVNDNESILTDIVKAIEPLGDGFYLFRFTIY